MRLTENFTQREFKTKEDVSYIVKELQILRDFLGERIKVVNYKHNKYVDIKSYELENEDLILIINSLIDTKDLKKGKTLLNKNSVRYEIN